MKIISQPNLGVSAARNRGLKIAEGKYIAFLDADDTWDPRFLKKLHQALETRHEAVIAYCGWQNLGLPGGQGAPYVPPDYETEGKLEKLLKSCPWPIHAALSRREGILATGGFDESLTNSEDYRLWLTIAAEEIIIRVPEVLAYYHFHDGIQATKNKAKAALCNWEVKKEFIRVNPDITASLGKARIQSLVDGMLLKKGYECYWARNLEDAQRIFRVVMKTGFGNFKDWKYMVPTLLPGYIYRRLIKFLDRNAGEDA